MSSKLDPHREEILRMRDGGASVRHIARHFGVNKDTVGQWLVRFTKQGHVIAPAPAAIDYSAAPNDEELLRAEARDLRAAVKAQREREVLEESILREFRATVVPAEPLYETPEQADGEGHPHLHCLLLSDWHVGEIVDSEAMNGINAYDWSICQSRMNQVLDALVSFQNKRSYPVDELVVGLLGDMNGGRNHQELAETNEFPMAEQCVRTGQLIGQFLEQVSDDYPKIRVIGVAGNHPRVPIKPASKQAFDNFDWLSYKYAELYLSKFSHIEWSLPRSGYRVADIAGKNMLFFHGDGIRSSMPGVPWGGVARRVNELKKQYAEQGTLLSYFALGHFHQANVVQGSVFMNGSLKGADEYSLKQFGGGERPTQLLLTFDKTKERLTDVSFITPA